MQVCDLNICSKPAAEKHQVNTTSWEIKDTRSHIHRSHQAHCGSNYRTTFMSKHYIMSTGICDQDTVDDWKLLKFYLMFSNGSWWREDLKCNDLHIEKDLMRMYIFCEEADVKQS